jgi:hypothetical protein
MHGPDLCLGYPSDEEVDHAHRTSDDGTAIARTQWGSGPAVVLVDGAFCYRASVPAPKLAPLLARQFTVFAYDRRGRGESGDAERYSIRREIEDGGRSSPTTTFEKDFLVLDAEAGVEGVGQMARSGRASAALRVLAVAGNVLFIGWLLFNAIDDGFRGPPPQIVSGIALIGLLVLDSVLIWSRW